MKNENKHMKNENKHMKRSLTLLGIREIQIKTTMRYPFIHSRTNI